MGYDDNLCNERHNQIRQNLESLVNITAKHSDEINELQQVSYARNTEVNSMCKSIDSLNKRIDKIIEQNRNLLITVITILVGFFMYAIERGIFK